MNSSKLSLDSDNERRDFYSVIIITSIMFSLSCIGALYVIFKTYKTWNNSNDKKKSINMSNRLPFYTSLIGN